MKKVKEFSISYIFLSFLYVAIGIVLVIWPGMSIQLIGRGLGIIMLVVGATFGVIYFTRDKRREGYLQMELVVGIICLSLGVFILLTPDFMRMVLPFAMATVLLVGAIVKIQTAVSMKRLFVRKWFLGLIAALIIIGLGIFLLVFPFPKDWQMLLYIGICLILDGMTNLLGLLCIRLRTRKLEKMQKKNPGTDVKALIEQERADAEAAKADKKAKKQAKKRQANEEVVVESTDVMPDVQDETSPAQEAVPDVQDEKGPAQEVVPAGWKRSTSADEKQAGRTQSTSADEKQAGRTQSASADEKQAGRMEDPLVITNLTKGIQADEKQADKASSDGGES
ncbi:MAG: DUF308 domain-containing protein [Lachnospiraceae bacterium]|nr:DUF308 domain-containing protein [Lachnospiraceae bacterium]